MYNFFIKIIRYFEKMSYSIMKKLNPDFESDL